MECSCCQVGTVCSLDVLRCREKCVSHPDFRHKRWNQALWLHSAWVDSQEARLQVATRDIPGSVSPFNASPREPGTSLDAHELETLCRKGRLREALLRLDQQGVVPSERVYKDLLQACGKRKAAVEAKQVHAHLAKHGLESNRVLGDLLVTTLVTCGSFEDGLEVFNKLRYRTVYSWTAIISGYSNAGQCRQALACYEEMLQDGVEPDKYTFVALLKTCSRLEELEKGQRIHADVVRRGLENDVYIGNTLVSMYAKCGSILTAQQVFDGLSQRNVVSWSAMISAYAKHGQGEQALKVYEQMQHEGVKADARTFVSVFQACGMIAESEESVCVNEEHVKVGLLRQGKEAHAAAAERGCDLDIFVGNSLVSMYAKCGSIENAHHVFDRLPQRDVVSWNALLAAHAQQGQGETALHIYGRMEEEGIKPTGRTFATALQSCSTLAEREGAMYLDGGDVKVESLQKGKEIHADATGSGCELDAIVGNALVTMYAKCGSIMDAQQIFDGLYKHDVVTWTAIIAAYVQQGQGDKALEYFWWMQEKGIRPNARTFVSVLQACCVMAEEEKVALVDGQNVKDDSLRRGREIHAQAAGMGFELDVFVGSTLVTMYAKCGSIRDAEQVFNRLAERDVVSWTAMIAAYSQQDQGEKALQLFARMSGEGVIGHEATYLSVLEACSSTGALDVCLHIHRIMMKCGFQSNVPVANSLIYTFGKCGSMAHAQQTFDSLPEPDVVSWTALIAGYARLGDGHMSVQCFESMCMSGVNPNKVTFLALLSACSHAGMVEQGLEYFGSMKGKYGICPELEHYASVIDLVGRAGLLAKAEELVLQMPMQPDSSIWLSLLGACRKHGDVERARRAFHGAVGLDSTVSAPYVLMSSTYAGAGMWHNAQEVDQLRQSASAWKREPGRSWIEHDGEVHKFLVGDCRHGSGADLNRLLQQMRGIEKRLCDVTVFR